MSAIRSTKPSDAGPDNAAWLEIVRQQVESLRQGAVEIVIHEGRVVEIKKSERVRLGSKEAAVTGQPVISKDQKGQGA